MIEENLAEYWKEKIEESTEPASMLHLMYKSILQTDNNYYATFGKLTRIYGRNSVYFSILDCATLDEIEGDPLRILTYFCKKRLEENTSNKEAVIDIKALQDKIRKLNSDEDIVSPKKSRKQKERIETLG